MIVRVIIIWLDLQPKVNKYLSNDFSSKSLNIDTILF